MAFSWIFILFTVAISVSALVFYVVHELRALFVGLDHAPPPALNQKDGLLGFKLLQEIGRQSREGAYLVNAQKRFEETGYTFSMVLAGSRIFQTAEPANIKAILGEKQTDFDSGSVRFWSAEPLLGKGIFTLDGSVWAHSRALLKPCFSRREVSDLPLFETHLLRLFEKLPSDGEVVDLQPLFFQLSMDISTVFLLGESTSCLLGNTHGEEFARAFEFCSMEIMTRVRLGKLMFLHRSRKFTDACGICHQFADHFVRKALQTEKMSNDDHKKISILDELMTQTKDPLELRSQLLHLLLAGRDTTASLLSTLFFILAKRPDVWRKVRQEVLRHGAATPSYEQLKECKYLGYVLKEVLRLYPVIVSNSRMANKDTLLPTGGGDLGHDPVLVKKGQIVAYNYYVLHRRTDLFGEDAASFRPERWETARPKWSYLPFGGGARICIGQQFALTEVSYVLFRFAQTFESLRSVDPDDWQEKISITCTVRNGVKVVLSSVASPQEIDPKVVA